MRRLLIIAPILALWSTPALAWWEYAKWGMTIEQVTAASKGAAGPCDRGIADCTAIVSNQTPDLYLYGLTIAGYLAHAQFSFDQGKLTGTYLQFNNANLQRLTDALIGNYGAPVDVKDTWPATRLWRVAAKGTLVKIWEFPEIYKIVIEYKPITKGL